jgi:predicted Rossmann fold nucleotide-binding protein DprA/Smf involved in DNA uptake
VVQQDRTENRRHKLIAALAEQQLILEAQLKGEVYGQAKEAVGQRR